ncbi:hypothetical protein BDQ17DRAFT_1512233 [Cyathus striatus]|nr:hypothetical protein BDQ17DRAFT_1512233 [Cyathus striatus]
MALIYCILPLLLATLASAQSQVGWGMCGGIGWTGPTTCVAGYTCTYNNPYHSQCLPDSAPSSTTLTTTVSGPTSTGY